MSNLLVTDVQKQDPGSSLVELFELEISSGQYIYLHSGLTENLSQVRFRDRANPLIIRTYIAMPIEISGIEASSDGAQTRPTLTVANVTTLFRTLLDGFSNGDLVGKKIFRRQTLKKYLYGEENDSNPPFEFPVKSFFIDRVSGETPLSVDFELASPFDLSGVELPSRVVVGKYCSWIYQGAAAGKGGCVWPADNTVNVPKADASILSHKVYYTPQDEPIVPIAAISGGYLAGTAYAASVYVSNAGAYWLSKASSNLGNTPGANAFWWQRVRIRAPWASGQSYTTESYTEYSSGIWRAKYGHLSTVDNFPYSGSPLWERADLCGKQLSSCKCRFQFIPKNIEVSNQPPSIEKDTRIPLPFGAFPGAAKFR